MGARKKGREAPSHFFLSPDRAQLVPLTFSVSLHPMPTLGVCSQATSGCYRELRLIYSEASQRITPSQPHAGTDGGHSLSSHTVVSRGSYWGGGHTRPLKMTVWEAMSQSGFITSLVVFVHPQTGDGTTISLWSSKPHEGLTICRFQSKGSTFFSVILRPLSIGPAGV